MTILTPRSIELRRAKGWRMPENTVPGDVLLELANVPEPPSNG
jgi:hypothetical protein